MTDFTYPTRQGEARDASRFYQLVAYAVAVAAIVGALVYWAWQPASGDARSDLLDRSSRFGVFRDLVLVERPRASGGAFFLDRFETTRADWFYYQSAVGGGTPGSDEHLAAEDRDLPVTSVALTEARRFARWRFCRLPRHDELLYASTQGGASQYPWGDRWVETWANTHGLNLGRAAPVGSFESGRSTGGPYDLIGNVSEWTESVDLPMTEIEVLDTSWMRARGIPGVTTWFPGWLPLPVEWLSMGEGLLPPKQALASAYTMVDVPRLPGVSTLRGAAGLTCWLPSWSPRPLEWFVMAEDDEQPRLAVGGDYRTTVGKSPGTRIPTFPIPRPFLAGRKSDTTGLRVAATPEGLLRALLTYGVELTAPEREVVLRFVSEPKHRRALRSAWRLLRARSWFAGQAESPVAQFLAAELDS